MASSERCHDGTSGSSRGGARNPNSSGPHGDDVHDVDAWSPTWAFNHLAAKSSCMEKTSPLALGQQEGHDHISANLKVMLRPLYLMSTMMMSHLSMLRRLLKNLNSLELQKAARWNSKRTTLLFFPKRQPLPFSVQNH